MSEESAHLQELRARLAARAEREDLLEVAWRSLDSPLGGLLLAASDRGVVRVAFESEGEDAVLTELAATVSARILYAPARLDPAARALDAYFTGDHTTPNVPIDLRLVHGYRAEVVRALSGIPYGSTVSYAHLAASTGRPKAVRAVGTACARNPLPLLLPCHRVVRSDGNPGSYRGGAAAKAYLLEFEALG
ncbi:methylated-DNA--[protein]-cysteine S-methyltransferase [Naumannella sp. ID2617S]|uniref:methylated-DNA--[protein]-cysteine S-methyltransferase n=1 Tax=Enemella dayhoffiae TaxID=2016507 RepID=A0A255GV60_9ACTN|nr:methylated-DNA--[protein]-cysteine S-methyltransferase [Enemella dayhoffiae]NNG20939.1 methylated-DNA--[protein]-cysteine S-methyltransferase [Naumannella sp. ID2617S]OYO18696.1 cysteine methyltransferase [Enemella dayhoffiae]